MSDTINKAARNVVHGLRVRGMLPVISDAEEIIAAILRKAVGPLEAERDKYREALREIGSPKNPGSRYGHYTQLRGIRWYAREALAGWNSTKLIAGQQPEPRGERMSKFRKRPIVIEAHQWFKNGDHPDDDCEMVHPDPRSSSQFEPFLSEGKVVRGYRRPEGDSQRECEHCGKKMDDHGWIDTIQGGHVVCPGDWIIKDKRVKEGEHGFFYPFYPCKPDVFQETYDLVEAKENADVE